MNPAFGIITIYMILAILHGTEAGVKYLYFIFALLHIVLAYFYYVEFTHHKK